MQKSKNDVWVGLFVMIGGAAILFLALKAGNLLSFNFDETYLVSARFDNIGGLKPQAPIKSAGVVVGRVAKVSFDTDTYQARVDMNLQKQYVFPKDSSLKILTSGLLGEQYLGLEPGAEDKPLAAGDKISSTQSAVVLENLISQFLYSKAADSSSSDSGAKAGSAPGGEAKK